METVPLLVKPFQDAGLKTVLDRHLFVSLFLKIVRKLEKYLQNRGISYRIGLRRWRAVVAQVQGALDDAEIINWVSHGTLLGLIRDGGPIRGDKDIDFGFIFPRTDEQLLKALQFAKCRVIKVEGIPRVDFRLKLEVRGISVDLYDFVLRPNQDLARMTLWRGTTPAAFQSYAFDFPWSGTGKFILDSDQINVPNNPLEYLESHYGSDWRTPTGNWSIWDSPRNLTSIAQMEGPPEPWIPRFKVGTTPQ